MSDDAWDFLSNVEPQVSAQPLVLTFQRYAQQFVLDQGFTGQVQVERVERVIGEQAYRMITKVMSDELPPEKLTQVTTMRYHVPASTWQTWKLNNLGRWYGKGWLPWLLARRPVRYEERQQTVTCEFDLHRWRTYPKSKIPVPDDRFGLPTYGHRVADVRWMP